MEHLAISKFKATCLAVIDEVDRTGKVVVVTRRGVPVARITPVPATPSGPSRIGSMAGTLTMHDDLIEPAGRPEEWEAVSG